VEKMKLKKYNTFHWHYAGINLQHNASSVLFMKRTEGEACATHVYTNERERLQISSNKGRQLPIRLNNSCRVRGETFHGDYQGDYSSQP
jgi:hypothetical protein